MILDDFDPNNIRVEDQRDPEAARQRRIALEFLDRYLSASDRYRERNPNAPTTNAEEWIMKQFDRIKTEAAWDHWIKTGGKTKSDKKPSLADILFQPKR